MHRQHIDKPNHVRKHYNINYKLDSSTEQCMSIAPFFYWQKLPFSTHSFTMNVEAFVWRFYLDAERRKIILRQLNAIDNTEAGCCENRQSNPHPRSFIAGIWSTMGKKHWRWIGRIPCSISLLVSCWDLNKPKDYLRAFKCKCWWVCKAPPVNPSLIICLPD